ncbi:zinc finger BED domain-containing protein RICESLEEPER 1-like [Nicotiana tomentosiformis]|uniref:zinc finger BED domain-containing protein RICESLEEPER 1-like n=1 Tax=Nicotiana tomentosiformis TaxID=4098 RepID=UPI00388C357B
MAENMTLDKVIGESGASNSNSTIQSQSVQLTVRKERKKRSRAWDHFDQIVDSEGNKKGVCKYCKREYFADTKYNGTKALLTHMANCKKIPLNVETSQSKLAFQPVPGDNKGDIAVVPWKYDQEQWRKALCSMVIIDELPFSFVKMEGFINFMKVAQPFFRIPSRRTMTRDCFDRFN